MISANTLLNKSNSDVVQNVPIQKRDPLYNPSNPVINDENLKLNIKDLRSVRLQDRYYTDMALNRMVKNGDGYSLGANDKGFSYFRNYDRSIDPNLMARRNPKNKLYTQPDDYYNGSFGAYYSLPKTIKRPAPIAPNITSLTDAMNAYQYKNTALIGGLPVPVQLLPQQITPTTPTTNTTLSLPAPIAPPPSRFDMSKFGTGTQPQANISNMHVENIRKLNDTNTIGFDPTTDPNYLKYQDELKKSELQNEAYKQARQSQKNIYNKYGLDTETDENGLPVIKPPMKIGISDIGGKTINI